MAKKRMYARNHGLSGARNVPRTNHVQGDGLRAVDDNGEEEGKREEEIDIPTIKEHAAQALKSGSSVSILCSTQGAGGQRHIRIAE